MSGRDRLGIVACRCGARVRVVELYDARKRYRVELTPSPRGLIVLLRFQHALKLTPAERAAYPELTAYGFHRCYGARHK